MKLLGTKSIVSRTKITLICAVFILGIAILLSARCTDAAEETCSTAEDKYRDSATTDTRHSVPKSLETQTDYLRRSIFEDLVKSLKQEIEDAKSTRIGVQPYRDALISVEDMIQKGEPQEKLELRLKQIRDSLRLQLQDQTRASDPVAANNQLFTRSDPDGLSLEQARVYILSLVNKERLNRHLSRLVMDPIATRAAQMHSDEMATLGYSGHWDSLGRQPDQRYSELGGRHQVGENVTSHDTLHRSGQLTPLQNLRDHRYSTPLLVKLETEFMNERPPNDLHRLMTLGPEHNKLGVGLSYSKNATGEWFLVLDQEFVDEYGSYAKLPAEIVRDQPFSVNGILFPGVNLYSISIYWEPEPQPMTRDALWMCPHEYGELKNLVAEYYPHFGGPVKIWKDKGRECFSISVVPQRSWKAGLYFIVIAATQKNKIFVVSTRTVHFEKKLAI